MDNDGELLRGNTPTLILAVLQGGERHGYGIAQEINRRSNNALNLKQGALYPALHALERDGMISGKWEIGDTERPRKVYHITEAGRAELTRRARSWDEFAKAIVGVLGETRREQPA